MQDSFSIQPPKGLETANPKELLRKIKSIEQRKAAIVQEISKIERSFKFIRVCKYALKMSEQSH
jgi:hypothetical protein